MAVQPPPYGATRHPIAASGDAAVHPSRGRTCVAGPRGRLEGRTCTPPRAGRRKARRSDEDEVGEFSCERLGCTDRADQLERVVADAVEQAHRDQLRQLSFALRQIHSRETLDNRVGTFEIESVPPDRLPSTAPLEPTTAVAPPRARPNWLQLVVVAAQKGVHVAEERLTFVDDVQLRPRPRSRTRIARASARRPGGSGAHSPVCRA